MKLKKEHKHFFKSINNQVVRPEQIPDYSELEKVAQWNSAVYNVTLDFKTMQLTGEMLIWNESVGQVILVEMEDEILTEMIEERTFLLTIVCERCGKIDVEEEGQLCEECEAEKKLNERKPK